MFVLKWPVRYLLVLLGYFSDEDAEGDLGESEADDDPQASEAEPAAGNDPEDGLFGEPVESASDQAASTAGRLAPPRASNSSPAPTAATTAPAPTAATTAPAPTAWTTTFAEEDAPATTAPFKSGKAEGKWSKHSSARLIHAILKNQRALTTIATGKSRQQLDSGENPWDAVAKTWCDKNWKPEPDDKILQTFGSRNCPLPANGLCGPRAGVDLKKKFASIKADMARYSISSLSCPSHLPQMVTFCCLLT